MRVVAYLLSALLLTACGGGTQAPRTYDMPIEIREARRMNISGSSVRAIQLRIALLDAPPGGLYFLASDFAFHPIGEAPNVYPATGECSAGPVPEGAGQTCTLYFEWPDFWPNEEVVPGRVYGRETVWSDVAARGLVEAFTDQ